MTPIEFYAQTARTTGWLSSSSTRPASVTVVRGPVYNWNYDPGSHQIRLIFVAKFSNLFLSLMLDRGTLSRLALIFSSENSHGKAVYQGGLLLRGPVRITKCDGYVDSQYSHESLQKVTAESQFATDISPAEALALVGGGAPSTHTDAVRATIGLRADLLATRLITLH